MVEMTEAAYILNRATSRSLVLIDEIGRGHLHVRRPRARVGDRASLAENNRSLALFATHYFELTALPSEIDGCANVHFDAVETKGQPRTGHRLPASGRGRSGEPQLWSPVARLAGVPADTLKQAQRYFARLDKFNTRDDAQHDLFAGSGAHAAREPGITERAGANRGGARSTRSRCAHTARCAGGALRAEASAGELRRIAKANRPSGE
jgi:DNA mismatch repair protein MutS